MPVLTIDDLTPERFDTVIVAGADMQGRLFGRRLPLRRFLSGPAVGVDICTCVFVWDIAEGLGDEDTPARLEEMTGPYKRSKFLAERVALEFAGDGFPVVIVNPTAPVGDHDVKPTPTGKILVDFLRGTMPGFLDTGLNIVDVADVAEGHLRACDQGRTGERYILALKDERSGDSSAAGLASTAWAGVTGAQPLAPLDGVRMARKKMWVRHDKAARELGYEPGPAAGALERAVEWFRMNGYC